MHTYPLVFLLAAAAAVGCSKQSSNPSSSSPPSELFQNVTDETGVHFRHLAGTNYFMPDQIGSGVMVFDFDNDGRLDLYFVQNAPESENRNKLFQQGKNGHFIDVSENSGLAVSGHGMGAIAGDLNNDGLADVVVTEYGNTRVFQNMGGGRFKEITVESGVDNPRWAVPASFIDFDRDGWLDLAVGNYADYDPTQICHDQQGRQDFCAPGAFPRTPTRLWRNVTKKAGEAPRFQDCTVSSGINRHPGVALGIVCADFTGDHWPDIFCSDDGRPNRLFVNQKNGTFMEEAAQRGLAYDAMGRSPANMGVAYADINSDGLPDLFVTHLSEEFHSLFRQDQPGRFLDTISQSGMLQQAWRGTGFGTVAADFNLDGEIDIAFVNGLIRRANSGQQAVIEGMDPWWASYAQRPQMFMNHAGKFSDASASHPSLCGRASVGRSLALADINDDGAPDLIVGNVGGPAQIYRNIARTTNHWLKLRLVLPKQGGRDAIGSEVRFAAAGRKFWGVLQPATSYLSSHEPVVHFGLGAITNLSTVEVIWPDGGVESFNVGAVNRTLVLAQGSGQMIP